MCAIFLKLEFNKIHLTQKLYSMKFNILIHCNKHILKTNLSLNSPIKDPRTMIPDTYGGNYWVLWGERFFKPLCVIQSSRAFKRKSTTAHFYMKKKKKKKNSESDRLKISDTESQMMPSCSNLDFECCP